MSSLRKTYAEEIAAVVATMSPCQPIALLRTKLRKARPPICVTSNEFRIRMSEENKAIKAFVKAREAQPTANLFPEKPKT